MSLSDVVQSLTESSSLTADQSARLERILEDYLKALEQGLHPEPIAIIQQHPDIAEPLQEYLTKIEALHRTALGLSGSQVGLEDFFVGEVPTCESLGDFRLLREIGRGGMGVVYEAEQLSLGRRVALKVLPFAAVLDPRQLRRFKNEAQAAALLKHPNIVGVYSVGCARGVHFYAMELVDGWSLARMIEHLRSSRDDLAVDASRSAGVRHGPDVQRGSDIRRGFPTPPTREPQVSPTADTSPIVAISTEYSRGRQEFYRSIALLGVQVAEALEYAHQEGVVHRDVKPSNLLLDAHGKLWITDLGLAQVQDTHDLTMTGDVLGTLRYMSPEQAAGRKPLDHRTDIYSLGITLYELLTMRPAFPGTNRQDVLRRIATAEPPAPRKIDTGISKDLETIVLKAISKEPMARYDTAAKLADDLQRFLDQKPIQARRNGPIHQLSCWAKRNPVFTGLATAVIVLLIILAATGWTMAVRQSALVAAAELERRGAQGMLDRSLAQTALAMVAMEPEQLRLLNDMVKYYETRLEERPNDPETRFEVASAFCQLANVDYFRGDPKQSQALREKVVELAVPLFREDPAERRYRLLLARGYLGLAAQSGLRPDLAVKYSRQAIDLLEPLESEGSNKPSDLRLLAYSRVSFAGVLRERAGLYKEAEGQLSQSVDLWQRLDNESGGNFENVGGLAWARYQLAKLQRAGNRFREAELNMLLALKPVKTIDSRFW